MKVIVRNLLFSLLVVAMMSVIGCGESNTINSYTESNSSSPSKEAGAITLTLTKSPADLMPKTLENNVLPSPTHIRIVIRNLTTGFKAIKDVAVQTTTSVSIPVPVATGYTVDAISYVKESYYKRLLKHNQVTGIDVLKDVNTPANIVLQPITASINHPETTVAGDTITVTVNKSPVLKNFLYLQTSLTPITALMDSSNYSSGTFTFNSPISTVAGNLYFQVKCFIHDDFVDATEGTAGSFPTWTFYYPNPAYGDDPVSMPYTVPTGGIDLGITYKNPQ